MKNVISTQDTPMQKAAKLLLKENGWHVRFPGPRNERFITPLNTSDYDEAYSRANRLLRDQNVEWIIA